MADIAAELGQLVLFRGLAPAALDALAQRAFTRRLSRGQILFTAGEPSDQLFLIRSGRLRVVVSSPRGEELVLSVLGAGDTIGELSVLDGAVRSAGVDALEACELLTLPSVEVLAVLQTNPVALLALARELAAGMRRLTEHASDLVFLDLPRRLAKLLVAEGVDRPDGTVVCELSMSQSGVAARVGATRQSLNRALADLAKRNWIQLDGSTVLLVNPVAMQAFADS